MKITDVCRLSRGDAAKLGRSAQYEASFRLNVECARAIEQSIRDCSMGIDGDIALGADCAATLVRIYGMDRVDYVLTNSIQQIGSSCARHLISNDVYDWAGSVHIPDDGRSRYFAVDTAAAALTDFIAQFRALCA